MDGEHHTQPLAPAGAWPRSDYLEPASHKSLRPREVSNPSKCFFYFVLLVVVVAAILLVFAVVVWRVETPEFRLSNPSVRVLRYTASPEPSLNATLTANATIRNTNFGHCSFKNRTVVSALYLGQYNFGHDWMAIEHKRVRARYIETFNVSIELRSSLLKSAQAKRKLSSDLKRGIVSLTIQAQRVGRIRVTNILNKKRTLLMNCTMNLILTSHGVQNLICN
ncbi:hypothetical protein SAY86_012095 [Trapa natans]|uniref:Late embryogenesis abundant protein LEA-2 subgroup domain-containing protein n=1 Tax=Trapa natans TaxID=22666 RepID=A0AAN7RBA1_TRANT|nr:hypothetical protein SAY86_012095 [Trapa natans]